MELFWLTFYLTLPAFLGNSIPVIAKKLNWLKFLNIPVDFYKTFRKKRISGDNKTIRGFVFAIIIGLITGLLQYFLHQQNIFLIPYFNELNQFILFGVIGGFSALFGDVIESFFKRQLNIKPGKPFIPFDQLDYLIGFSLLTYPLIHWSFTQFLYIFSFGLISPIVNLISYHLKIKDTYW